jgi:hypothetical protein
MTHERVITNGAACTAHLKPTIRVRVIGTLFSIHITSLVTYFFRGCDACRFYTIVIFWV